MPLDYPVTLTFEQLVRLTMILTDYRNEAFSQPISDELQIYRYVLTRQLIRQLRAKAVAMDDKQKRECKITFSVEHVYLVHLVLVSLNYGPDWQGILNAFDKAKVNLLPVHPPLE